MKYTFIVIIMLLITSCAKSVRLEQVISVQERVSYAGVENLRDTVPQLYDAQLEKAGVLKNGRFVPGSVSEFKSNSFIEAKGLPPLRFTIQERSGTLKVFCNRSADTIKVGVGLPPPTFGWADVVPGGYKELVVYNTGYIINGTNYSVVVYEVK